MSSITQSDAWSALRAHAEVMREVRTLALFDADDERATRLSCQAAGLYLDYSKQRVDGTTLQLLQALAQQQELAGWIERLFSGEHVNVTEDRAALHMALRADAGDVFNERGVNVVPQVHAVLERMATFADSLRYGQWRGATGKPIADIVNIGIGGSDFGPRMVCTALAPMIDGPRPHFVSNVDGSELHALLQRLNPETTLFIVASKTFTTQETLSNAMHAKAWLVSSLGAEAVPRHFAAVSTNVERAGQFGIPAYSVFEFWDWVGGRYSLWSAIGLPIMVALGPIRFADLMHGARSMDQHFRTAPHDQNMPVMMGLLSVWNRNFLGCESHVLAPYSQRLSLLTGWAQQLEMESNGKGVSRAGEPLGISTTPVLWGSVGTNAQHAYFQMLHQGPALHAVDFILPVVGDHPFHDMHRKLMANCFAQSSALLRGKSAEEVRAELTEKGLSGPALEAAIPPRVFPGNRPSNTLLFPRIDPFHLGALLALYEHRTFVESVMWEINPFDQWGVELGKQLAHQILDPEHPIPLDPSTAELMRISFIHRND
jgi:glucose-6-phosphate isomerase